MPPTSFGYRTDDAVTPDRKTVMEFDYPQYHLNRPSWFMRRHAEDIAFSTAKAQSGFTSAAQKSDMMKVPSAWIMKPLKAASVNVLLSANENSVIPPSEVTLHPSIVPVNMSPVVSDLVGVERRGDIIPTAPGYRRRVPAGGTFNSFFSSDQASLVPPPRQDTPIFPQDRVIIGNVSYPENQAYGMAFSVDADWWGKGDIYTFYFGGPASIRSLTSSNGGFFSLSINGSGYAWLHELDGPQDVESSWKWRMGFRWAEPNHISNNYHHITIIPYSRNLMAIFSRTTDTAVSPLRSPIIAAVFSRGGDPTQNFFLDNAIETGHDHLFSMTGRGGIRLDVSRETRNIISLYRMKYTETADLLDGSIFIPYPIPAGTPIIIDCLGDTYTMLGLGGNVTAQVYDATTNAPLSVIAGDGTLDNPKQFGSVLNQQNYYVKLTFTSGLSQFATPALFSYTIEVPGVTTIPNWDAQPFDGKILRVDATGPDIQPDQDNCNVVIEDVLNELTVLQHRDRVPVTVKVIRPSDSSLLGYLFEGNTVKPQADFKGFEGMAWPSEQWRAYNPLRLVGMWGRLADQLGKDMLDFRQDPTAPANDATGQRPPWKVTDIIRFLFLHVGVPPDQIDVPDDPFRLWPSNKLSDDQYMLWPTLSYADYLTTLSVKFLGRYIVRDRNAGPNGMWRLLPNPQPPYNNVLCEFVKGKPTSGGAILVTAPGAYGTGPGGITRTFMLNKTFRPYPKAPEFNYLVVTATGQITPNASGRNIKTVFIHNPKSFDFDPGNPTATDRNSPDYIGWIVPMVVYDPLLPTEESVQYVARRLFDFAGHGEDWTEWIAPLVWVTDPLDTFQVHRRPLRINDIVRVDGRKAVIRSCNPSYKNDVQQWAHHEAKWVE